MKIGQLKQMSNTRRITNIYHVCITMLLGYLGISDSGLVSFSFFEDESVWPDDSPGIPESSEWMCDA